jgi:hypothetical protein
MIQIAGLDSGEALLPDSVFPSFRLTVAESIPPQRKIAFMKTKTLLMKNSIRLSFEPYGKVTRVFIALTLACIALSSIALAVDAEPGEGYSEAQRNAAGRSAVLYAAKGTFGVQGVLFTLDPATGAVLTTVGSLNDRAGHNYGMSALKYHPISGILYGASSGQSPTNPNYLVIVDPDTALVTPIGPLGAVLTDIAIDPTTGTMYAVSGFNQKFYTINTATGQATQTGSTGLGYQNGGGLAADRTGALFGIDSFSFYSYNKTTGNGTLIGLTGLPDFVRAADFNPSNVLYGLEGGGGIDNLHLRFLVTFNLTTGLGMLVGVIPVSDLDAMAFIPVTR